MRQEHAKRNNRLARSEVGDAFIDAGFSLVSLANNHTLDRGEDGVLRSLDYWSDKEASSPPVATALRKTGTKYAKPPKGKQYCVNVYDPDVVRADLEIGLMRITAERTVLEGVHSRVACLV